MKLSIGPVLAAALVCCVLSATATAQESSYSALPLLPLSKALGDTRRSHPQLAASKERIDQAATMVRLSWTFLVPYVNFNGTYRRADQEVALDMSSFGQVFALASLNCPDWDTTKMGPKPDLCAAASKPGGFGGGAGKNTIQDLNNFDGTLSVGLDLLNARAFPQIPLMKRNLELSRLDAELTEENVLYSVVSLYYAIASGQAAEDLAAEQVSIIGELLLLLKAREASGTALPNERIRLEISQAQAVQSLDLAKLNLRNLRRSLSLVTGSEDSGDFRVSPPPLTSIPEPDSISDPASTVERRTDLKMQQKLVQIQEYGVDDLYMQYFPTLKGSWNYVASTNSGFSGDNTQWNATISLSWSIFDRGIRSIQLDDARAKVREARFRHKAAVQEARRQLETAATEIDSSEVALEQGRKIEGLARSNFQLLQTQYGLGVTDQVTLLDGNREYISAKMQVILAELRTAMARISFARALGSFNESLKSIAASNE